VVGLERNVKVDCGAGGWLSQSALQRVLQSACRRRGEVTGLRKAAEGKEKKGIQRARGLE